jgi:Ca-activated chloride channel family protein
MLLRARWMLGVMLVLAGCSASEGGSELNAQSRDGSPSAVGATAGSGGSGASGPLQSGSPAYGNGSQSMSVGQAALAGSGGSSAYGASSGAAGSSAGVPANQAPADPSADPSNQGDKYTSVGVNPFVLVAHDPFSTFAADVDTASYDLFRRDVNLGLHPEPASVRLEDYVNNFAYDYPAPAADAEDPFAISLAAAPHPVRDGITLLRVGIQARLRTDTTKKPANLVFLVDTSGSMQSAEKLPIVQRVMSQALGVLEPTDSVSIVTYASGTGVALAPTKVQNAETIQSAIDQLHAAGSTNGAGGIQLAYEKAFEAFIEGGINHIILCTDGDFNVGLSSDDELVKLIEEKRQTGITLTALGFGIGNLNDSMMEKVSNAGNGIYSVLSSKVQADMYVEDRLLATMEHVAKDVKLQVELNPKYVLAYRLLGYEDRAIADEDFRVDTVDAGEIGAGHRVTALYELVMADGTLPKVSGAPDAVDGKAVDGEREIDAKDLVLVKVRYKQPGASATDAAIEIKETLEPAAVAEDVSDDVDLEWAVAMAMLAEVVKGSPYSAPSDLNAIATTVSAQASRDAYRTELADLFTKYRALK